MKLEAERIMLRLFPYILNKMTPIETTYSNNLKIKFIKDQIFEYKYRLEVSNHWDNTWWYTEAIKSLEKRIELYK